LAQIDPCYHRNQLTVSEHEIAYNSAYIRDIADNKTTVVEVRQFNSVIEIPTIIATVTKLRKF